MTIGWDGILTEDETILWQGKPNDGLFLTKGTLIVAALGLLFAAVGTRSTLKHVNEMGFSVFSLFPILFALAGLYLAVSAVFGPAHRRKYSTYTLTTKRAFIATALPFRPRALAFYSITPDTKIHVEDTAPASIYFAEGPKKNGKRTRVGFERIAEGPTVLQMIRDIQKDAI